MAELCLVLYRIAARSILLANVASWGERDTYHATIDELRILIEAGGEIVTVNCDNHDGSYSHHVRYDGTNFLDSSHEVIVL